MLLGSVEAGGTKFVCAVGDEDYRVQTKTTFKTTSPEETLAKTIAFFAQFPELDALGIASFGPIEIRRNDPKYGYVTKTPKPNWSDTDFVGTISKAIKVPIAWTTDVNGSAYGEYTAATLFNEKNDSIVYYTVGTGVGAGIVVDGEFLGTTGHPEMGHVRVKRHPDDLTFAGICPYHGDCLEGLVAGPTFEARTGKKGQDVKSDDHVWDIMAYYLAQAALQATLTLRPDKIVFGGGVMSETFLAKVRTQFAELLNDYIEVKDLNEYLTLPVVKDNGSATMGNFALAMKELSK
ncbi:ROK family protein [Periweissella cryptocerci]|uniref:Fructokinase n=1 Tax=Periweissella cryptocerci TaxID=2506420 RepID=A0A4P6YSJ1_9LACO|nr:fructokinase ScrK [Periweissella cryptocerci]QBO35678.1 ROK family protein [Periweissella cryptocerci]